MSIRKTIAYFLLLFLLIVFSNGVKGDTFISSNSRHYTITPSIKNAIITALVFDGSNLSFNKHTLRQYKLKVRYMAGECSFDGLLLPLSIHLPEFIDNKVSIRDCIFIPSGNIFLFKLRGPPSSSDNYSI